MNESISISTGEVLRILFKQWNTLEPKLQDDICELFGTKDRDLVKSILAKHNHFFK